MLKFASGNCSRKIQRSPVTITTAAWSVSTTAEIVNRLGTRPVAILRMAAMAQIAASPTSSPASRPPSQPRQSMRRPGAPRTRSGSRPRCPAAAAAGGAPGARAWRMLGASGSLSTGLGGNFGVAVVGAVFSSVYGPRLAQLLHGAGLPAPALAAARQSPAAALQVAGRAPASTHAVIIDAANRAFVAGLSRGSLVCAGVVALRAVFAFLVLPRRLPDISPSPPAAPGSKPGRTSSAQLSRPRSTSS
jgi:hypothetical protein